MAPPYPFNCQIMWQDDRLTTDQQQRAQELTTYWPGVQVATEAADRSRAEAAISDLYRLIGAAPPRFRWADSPAVHDLPVVDEPGPDQQVHWTPASDAQTGEEPTSMLGRLTGHRPSKPISFRELISPRLFSKRAFLAYQQQQQEQRRLEYQQEWDRRLPLWADLVAACGGWWPGTRLCTVLERPVEVHVEPSPRQGPGVVRLHRRGGLALRYRDGWGLYALHGTYVPEEIACGDRTGIPSLGSTDLDVAGLINDSDADELARRFAGNFRGADLRGACFPEGAALSGADLSGTDLRYAYLGDWALNLAGTNFAGADLRHTNMGLEVDLSGANLNGANLTGAYFSGGGPVVPADLIGATLLGATLTNADLVGVNISAVRWDDRTTWPDGLAAPIREISEQDPDGTFRVHDNQRVSHTWTHPDHQDTRT